MKKILKNKKGSSLMELIVAIAIFSIMILAITAIFEGVSRGQRNTIASQYAQGGMKYTMETISKEIRLATNALDSCELVLGDAVYKSYNIDLVSNIDGPLLYFKNKNNECVEYYQDDGKFMVRRAGVEMQASPSSVRISNLKFDIVDSLITTFRYDYQPRVTIAMTIEVDNGRNVYISKMDMQTTISSRNYQ